MLTSKQATSKIHQVSSRLQEVDNDGAVEAFEGGISRLLDPDSKLNITKN